MNVYFINHVRAAAIALLAISWTAPGLAQEPLPSWNDTAPNYLKRAIVSQIGLGANLPEDAIYPLNLGDATGKPLDGANKYTTHFDKGATPPVNAFWSITLYDSEGFQVGNSLNRFTVAGLDAVQDQRRWLARHLFPE